MEMRLVVLVLLVAGISMRVSTGKKTCGLSIADKERELQITFPLKADVRRGNYTIIVDRYDINNTRENIYYCDFPQLKNCRIQPEYKFDPLDDAFIIKISNASKSFDGTYVLQLMFGSAAGEPIPCNVSFEDITSPGTFDVTVEPTTRNATSQLHGAKEADFDWFAEVGIYVVIGVVVFFAAVVPFFIVLCCKKRTAPRDAENAREQQPLNSMPDGVQQRQIEERQGTDHSVLAGTHEVTDPSLEQLQNDTHPKTDLAECAQNPEELEPLVTGEDENKQSSTDTVSGEQSDQQGAASKSGVSNADTDIQNTANLQIADKGIKDSKFEGKFNSPEDTGLKTVVSDGMGSVRRHAAKLDTSFGEPALPKGSTYCLSQLFEPGNSSTFPASTIRYPEMKDEGSENSSDDTHSVDSNRGVSEF